MQGIGHRNPVGAAQLGGYQEILEAAHAAAGDHRHRRRLADLTDQIDVKTLAGALPVDRGQKDLPGPYFDTAPAPWQDVQAGPLPAIIGIGLPFALGDLLGLDRQDHGLGAEMARNLTDEPRTGNGGGVNGHLVGPRPEDMPGIVDRADAAADRYG